MNENNELDEIIDIEIYAKEGKVYSVIPGSTKDLEPFVKK